MGIGFRKIDANVVGFCLAQMRENTTAPYVWAYVIFSCKAVNDEDKNQEEYSLLFLQIGENEIQILLH